MKKIISVLLLIFVMLASNGCNIKKSVKDDATATPPETAVIEPENIVEEEERINEFANGEETKTKYSNLSLPFTDTLEMAFSSGAGAWQTIINLDNNGDFTGEYSDSNMGETGEGYPKGTVYICKFRGKFNVVRQIDKYTYYLELDELVVKPQKADEWIEDGVRYISSEPYGLETGKRFTFYTPSAPTKQMDEVIYSWWPGRYADETYETFGYYGLHNVDGEYAFFGNFR